MLGFISGLRVIKMIKEQIQQQSQRLIFSQCTYYNDTFNKTALPRKHKKSQKILMFVTILKTASRTL